MDTNNMTREQAAEIVGVEAVDNVERQNCEPTGRVGFNGACQDDELCEWSASVICTDKDGNACCLTAYYYTSNDEDAIMAEHDGDGSYIDWEIDHYAVV
ncbi:MAG TPA: hypothetical protein PK620_13390 [Denitromonas sp.]|nr:hypothetical protein [Zoogloeaceae bacterium]HQU89738.1 hypothetical protein [Denitromonas sp.]HQV15907.1 hypothetical protein [Denitromonas sp.]